MSTAVREARLRPDAAEVYPEIPSGRWMPARELAEILVRRARVARGLSIHQRTLDVRHFEFRGGAPDGRPQGARTRRTDQPEGESIR
jgi:hypothetical protein